MEVGDGGGFDWGGVEGCGEKANNCDWITIKIKKKEISRTLCKVYDCIVKPIQSITEPL